MQVDLQKSSSDLIHGFLPSLGFTFTILSKRVRYEPTANSSQLFQKSSSTTAQRFQNTYPAEISYVAQSPFKLAVREGSFQGRIKTYLDTVNKVGW